LGPTETLFQIWLAEEIASVLTAGGLQVVSSHQEGRRCSLSENGCVDLIFAYLDGIDVQTLYELGWARQRNIPVVCFSEKPNPNDEALKMVRGSGAIVTGDFSTAIYQTHWAALS
jgi:nucleoside 2-deoxyribosyltransferase